MNILWNLFAKDNELKTVAYIIASSLILQSFISLISGVFVDKYSKKNILTMSLLGFILITFICYITSSSFIIVATYFLFVVLNILFKKTFIVMVAHQLPTNEFIKYDAISGMFNQIISIICNVISGILLSFMSRNFIYLIIFSGFFVALMIILKIQEFDKENEHKNINTKITVQFINNNVIRNKEVLIFIIMLFLLNLNYGYIPNVLPYFMISISKNINPLFLSFLKSAVNIGEIMGNFVIIYKSKKVSKVTKIGLIGSSISFITLPILSNYSLGLFLVLTLYGFFDTLTQPLFSYFISTIENGIKGRMIGIIDCVVYLAAPIGIVIGNYLSKQGVIYVSTFISAIFFLSFFIFKKSIYNNIDLKEVD